MHGDAVEYLAGVSPAQFDVVLTSPPFKPEDVDGAYWELYEVVHDALLQAARRVVFIVQSATHLNTLLSRYQPDRTMVWGKQVSQYPYRYNPILCFQVDEDYNINKRIWTDAIGVPSVPPGEKTHKYQDPVRLYRTVLDMVGNCDSVLDPFMGSGTTMVAAQQVGMNAVGVDNEWTCIETAKQRLQQQTLTTSTTVEITSTLNE